MKKNKTKNLLKQQHRGEVAFEYIIVLVIIAVVIFSSWKALGPDLINKTNEIGSSISNSTFDTI